MAKRGRKKASAGLSMDGMVDRLKALDAERHALVGQIESAITNLFGGENPFPWGRGKRKPGRPARAAAPAAKAQGRRPGFKMSKAARAKISAAQKARWARSKKAGKKGSSKGGDKVGNG